MLARPALLGALVFALSCAPSHEHTVDVVVDAEFARDDVDIIADALHEWTRATGARFGFGERVESGDMAERAEDADGIVLVGYSHGPTGCPGSGDLQIQARPGHTVVGYTYRLGRSRVECLRMPPPRLRQTVLHETGHALGLGHYHGDERAVMRADADDPNSAEHLTDADMLLFCVARAAGARGGC